MSEHPWQAANLSAEERARETVGGSVRSDRAFVDVVAEAIKAAERDARAKGLEEAAKECETAAEAAGGSVPLWLESVAASLRSQARAVREEKDRG